MRWAATFRALWVTGQTLVLGAVGAGLGAAIGAPLYMLVGPAVAVSLMALAGVRTSVDLHLRDLCFVVLGIAVGGGFDEDALAAMLRWPLAFLFMALVLWAILTTCHALLARFFGFDHRSAILAAAPGHLSFVVAIAAEGKLDVARIAIVQSVRLLALTLVVPLVALAMGADIGGDIAPVGPVMALDRLAGVAVAALVLGALFARIAVPAPLLMGAMVASAVAHLTGWAPGVLPGWLILPAYLVLGALIGTRFSGVTPTLFLSGLGAGLSVTAIALGLAGLGALPVAWALGMPLAHVLVAFAPGGLETMIAMGTMVGVVPGFVAACHIARLLVLTVLLPAMLARAQRVNPHL